MRTKTKSPVRAATLLIGLLVFTLSMSAHAVPRLYGLSYYDGGQLYISDPVTGLLQSGLSLQGPFRAREPYGIAVHPATNEMFAVVSARAPSRVMLIRIAPETGDFIVIGEMSQSVAAIDFADTGVLYAVSGDCVADCVGQHNEVALYTIDLSDASLNFVQPVGNGKFYRSESDAISRYNRGEGIAFNPDDGMMYHISGSGPDILFERINLDTGVVMQIPLSGVDIAAFDRQARGLVWDAAQGKFIGGLGEGGPPLSEYIEFATISLDGSVTVLCGFEEGCAPAHDLAFYGASDSDGDGVPDNEDAFPSDPSESVDTDGDGIGNNADIDDDNDGVPDVSDEYPLGRFIDVSPQHEAFIYVESLARAGMTAGCRSDNYCPDNPVTRAQMAVFLERGMNGSDYVPAAATGNVFLDVFASDFASDFIEQLYADGVTVGCGNNQYCPRGEVTRAQMAVFLLRAKYSSGYSPPAATGIFNDVDLGYWAVHWIEQLAAEGITAGCGNGNYCPGAPVTRAQMAVFLVRTFGL